MTVPSPLQSDTTDTHSGFFARVVERPVAVVMITIAIFVFGLIAYYKLPLTLLPDINYPTLTVRTAYPGASPEEVETEISILIEERLSTLPGLRHMTSVSRAERADTILEFRWGTDVDLSLQLIAEKIDRVRFKEAVERPLILRYDPALEPIAQIGVSGDFPLTDLWVYADEILRRRLEAIEGVASARARGGLKPEVHVEVNPESLSLRGMDLLQLSRRLADANVNAPGGRIKDGDTDYFIRANNAFTQIQDLNELPLLPNMGSDLRLGDVAKVHMGHSDETVRTRINGEPGIVIDLYREADSNIVGVAQKIRKYLNGKRFKAPQGIDVLLLQDKATFIEDAITQVKTTALQGAALAIIILFLFLKRFLPTLIMGLSIPLSVMATFIPLFTKDISLNLMTLGGLALGIGMLVDNSIVVLESIARCHQEKDSPFQAAIRGTQEVAQAVIASTLTTLAVFFPIVFVEGIAGQLFGDLALVIVFSLVASLIVSLTIVPALSPYLYGTLETNKRQSWRFFKIKSWSRTENWSFFKKILHKFWMGHILNKLLGCMIFVPWLLLWSINCTFEIIGNLLFPLVGNLFAFLYGFGNILLTWIERCFLKVTKIPLQLFHQSLTNVATSYEQILHRVEKKPLIFCGFILMATLAIFGLSKDLGISLIPNMSQGSLKVTLRFPVGTPLDHTINKAENLIRILKDEVPDLTTVLSAGIDPEDENLEDVGEHIAQIVIKLPKQNSAAFQNQENIIQETLREAQKNIADAELDVSRPALFSVKKPVTTFVKAHSADLRKRLSNETIKALSKIEGLVDIRSTEQKGYPEYQIQYNRERLLGLPYAAPQVAKVIQSYIIGDVVGSFPYKGRLIDIRLLPTARDTFNLEKIKQKPLFNYQGQSLTLSHFAEVSLGEGPMEIRRLDGLRGAEISANYEGFNLGGINHIINERIDMIERPVGSQIHLGGQAEEMKTSLNALFYALMLSVFLVYVVMASQFESLKQPFLIMSVVPLALAGALIGLLLLDVSLSVMALLGMIVLVGIVVNNAIVMVDTANQKAKHAIWSDAVKNAALIRFRPILITAMTTILGLLPMVLFGGAGAEVRLPLALTVIAGLAWATLLTLFIVPALLFLFPMHEKEGATDTGSSQ